MQLVYVDDSTEGGDLSVMGAIILPEHIFTGVDRWLAATIEHLVPEPLRNSFEFHASALFHGKPPFEGIERDQAVKILRNAASVIESDQSDCFVFYGAVNLRELKQSHYATSQPLDVAFRSCLDGLQEWFSKQTPADEIGLLVCDDSSNTNLKKALKDSYRLYRGRVVGDFKIPCGLADYLHDDMYFGDSSRSIGLQLADIASFIILRHLQGREDTEFLYDMIKAKIYHASMKPEKKASPASVVSMPERAEGHR